MIIGKNPEHVEALTNRAFGTVTKPKKEGIG